MVNQAGDSYKLMNLLLKKSKHENGPIVYKTNLKTEHSDENIEFWLACEVYKKITSQRKRISMARKLFTSYIHPQAPTSMCSYRELSKTFALPKDKRSLYINAAAWKIFYAACKIFQTYEKISSALVDLDRQQSQLMWLEGQRRSQAARPARSLCKSSRGRWEELTSVPPARQPGKKGSDTSRTAIPASQGTCCSNSCQLLTRKTEHIIGPALRIR
ncbi:hypothetical protein IHE44_0014816 [Lamprotornis superbus]|uniref:RGS domain-containing protein n=1 Tax=Lamprotornis superbus TaxID=245042 RepID=A0A835P4W5_9PASS|nr:hypothetical protein IHE44_0014816 [Lamprotornis superbus]